MNSIKEDTTNEIIINKSRFITLLIKIDDINDINKKLDIVKKKYKDASHYCYAYIFNNIKRFSDDNEPGGTAGVPILNVLEKREFNNILCIVVRYFGGIKLGTGGLVRAYTKSVTSSLEKTDLVTMFDGYKIIIKFDYDKNKVIDILLKDTEIITKSFDEIVLYELLITKEKYDLIIEQIMNICLEVTILEEKYV